MQTRATSGRDIIVVGASAGGVEPVMQLIEQLPDGLEASVFVVMHFPRHATSVLPRILNRRGRLLALHPTDGQAIEHSHVYVAPPDRHMIVSGNRIDLVRGPHENGYRPSIDVLMRSAARQYGRRVIGIVLSGTLDDGTAGLVFIKRHGGIALVQDPEEATYPGMPRSAIENVAVDQVLTVIGMGPLITRLVRTPVEEGQPVPDEHMEFENKVAEFDTELLHKDQRQGTPATFTCPHCHGTLWENKENELFRYRCRVGHAYSPEALFAAETDAVETALWEALRSLEEMAAVSTRMANRARQRGNEQIAQRFGLQQAEAERRAEVLRSVLISSRPVGGSPNVAEPGDASPGDSSRESRNVPGRTVRSTTAAPEASGAA